MNNLILELDSKICCLEQNLEKVELMLSELNGEYYNESIKNKEIILMRYNSNRIKSDIAYQYLLDVMKEVKNISELINCDIENSKKIVA